ncbi:MAG: 2-C-methyl-D-erythritol 4-phosphate cytidylyltransferase [Prevotellaceae bacterium]|nr:2-C-methyl-D-erythritol 4-phosphate cytidylyltransferase [Prevotellaceae bacterium]
MEHLIAVAGGSGTRMGGGTPKQFLLLNGKPVLLHTLEKFYAYNPKVNIVLALPEAEIETWKQIVKNHTITIPHAFVKGGQSRSQSVRNALNVLGDSGLVAIHDGVRPLVSIETITRCFEEARKTGAAIPVMPLTDSLRRYTGTGSVAEDRAKFCAVQTPQVFDVALLKKAYEKAGSKDFTDDAAVVEAAGHRVSPVDGNVENIKITAPFDVKVAEVVMNL